MAGFRNVQEIMRHSKKRTFLERKIEFKKKKQRADANFQILHNQIMDNEDFAKSGR